MRKRIGALTLLTIALSLMLASAASDAGGASNPLVSLSYLTGEEMPLIIRQTQRQVDRQLDQTAATRSASALSDRVTQETQQSALEQRAASFVQPGGLFDRRAYIQGDCISGAAGGGFVLYSGSVKAAGTLIDVTIGREILSGAGLSPGHYYMFSERAGSSIEVLSANAWLGFDQGIYVRKTRLVRYENYADALKELGLFQGTNLGYELERPSSRIEGLVLFIRLMGEERQALAYTGAQPLSDVPAWADRYAAYAYAKGYAKGMGNGSFGASLETTAEHYCTFLLRALGYREENGDFVWSQALEDAAQLGVVSEQSAQEIRQCGKLYRDQIAYLSFQALEADTVGGTALYRVLINHSVFSDSAWSRAQSIVG